MELRVEISGSWLGKGVRFYMFVLSFDIFSAWCFFSLVLLQPDPFPSLISPQLELSSACSLINRLMQRVRQSQATALAQGHGAT
jgi:hypothetical protein